MKLVEVISLIKQTKAFSDGQKMEFEKMPIKKSIAEWRNLTLYESSAYRYKVVDHKGNLVYGFRCKQFNGGLSIIWAENYSNGGYKNLTKEIIVELLKSGIKAIYTDDKQTPDMMDAHKKILSKLPDSNLIVKKFNVIDKSETSDFSDVFDNRNTLFKFIWNKHSQKNKTFTEEIDESSWRMHQELILKKLLHDDTLYEWDEFFDLEKKARETLSIDEIEAAYLESGIYDNVADFMYEHAREENED